MPRLTPSVRWISKFGSNTGANKHLYLLQKLCKSSVLIPQALQFPVMTQGAENTQANVRTQKEQ